MLTEKTIELTGITSCSRYSNGQIEDCKVQEKNVIHTQCGDLIPRYSSPGIRSKELKSISFYESGAVRSIALEEQTPIQTPLGLFPAELVTFYENGRLDSIFPLNGQIGFGWSEREEMALAEAVEFEFPFGSFSAKPIGLRFYESGELRSLILWPGEVIRVNTALGDIPVRTGFKLYESGALASVEPAYPVAVETPIGSIAAFDVAAVGIDADLNSLRFDEAGALTRLATSGDLVVNDRTTGKRTMYSSQLKPGLTEDKYVKMPLIIAFAGDEVTIDDGLRCDTYLLQNCSFLVLPDFNKKEMDCVGDCDGCTGCDC